MGTFEVVKVGDRILEKNGGDVVTYFCTPELEVIHAVAGKIGPVAFLREAKWAADLAARLPAKGSDGRAVLARLAHDGATHADDNPNGRAVHERLAEAPLAPVSEVSRYFFEEILRERLSDREVTVTVVDEKAHRCRREALCTK